jgi:hypothetical protein
MWTRTIYAEGASLPPSSASAYTNTTETEQYYEIESKPELIASSATEAERQRGETDFRPFYYRYQYPSALKKPEISRTDILPAHLLQLSLYASSSHVYQTIFLDKDGSDELWTKGEIK